MKTNLAKTNVDGYEKDLDTNLIVSNDYAYKKFLESRKEREEKQKNADEIRQLKNNFSEMKNSIEELKSIMLKVVDAKSHS